MKPARIALLFLLALVVPASAQTPDPGCSSELGFLKGLFVGVSELTIAFTCPQQQGGPTTTAHVIRVDLGAPGLSFETSGAGGSGAFPVGPSAIFDQELTTAFLTRTKSQVAFNANLFTNCCCDYVAAGAVPEKTYLIGLQVSGGTVLSGIGAKPAPLDGSCGSTPPANFPFDYSLVVRGTALNIQRFVVAQADRPVTAAVTGSHLMVSGGRNVAPTENSGGFFGPNARTLVGLSGDDRILWIAAVDRSTSDGVTLAQAAQLMIQLGAAMAINLDGGGSTSLAVEDGLGAPRLLNQPNDTPDPSNPHKKKCMVAVNGRCERFVGASFGIHALPLPPTATQR
jgi:hypothetical protein